MKFYLTLVFLALWSSQGQAIPNPASQNCANKGGQLEIYNAPEGQTGICVIQEGRIEEWTLFRAASGPASLAVRKFLQNTSASTGTNPFAASQYCLGSGGTNSVVTGDQGDLGLCTFSDNSVIEVWTLYRGSRYPGNQELAKKLGAIPPPTPNGIDCQNLDGTYQEQTGFFSFHIQNGIVDTTGKLSYNGQTFYYRFNRPFAWSAQLKACSTTTYFNVYGCNYPVTGYLRKKIQNAEYVFGTINPTEIQPTNGCYMLGNTDRPYTVIRY